MKRRTIADGPMYFRVAGPKGPPAGVDREAGVIRGMSVVTEGEALGHGLWLDGEFLDSVVTAGNAKKGGIKSRFTHPGLSSDGLGTMLGKVSNFRRDGNRVLGDLTFAKTAFNTPNGDLASYVMDLAEESPDSFGTSIVYTPNREAEQEFASKNPGPDGKFVSPDPKNKRNYRHARLAALSADDVVDDPAANPGGFFAAGGEVPAMMEPVLDYVLGLSEECPDGVLLGAHPERARRYLADYLARRFAPVTGDGGRVTGDGDETDFAGDTDQIGADLNSIQEDGQMKVSKLLALMAGASILCEKDAGGTGPGKSAAETPTTPSAGAQVVDVAALTAKVEADAREKLRGEQDAIIQLCELAGRPEKANEFLRAGKTPAEVQKALHAERLSAPRTGALSQDSVTITADAREKFRVGLSAGLLLKAGGYRFENPKDAEPGRRFAGMKLMQMARIALREAGNTHVDYLTDQEVLSATFEGRVRGGIVPRSGNSFSGGPYNNSSSDFPLILRDVAHKRLQQAYQLTPTTYQRWVRIVPLSDFKANYVARLSEAPDPVEVGENGEITEGALFEGGESYALKTVGRKFSITRKTLIDDDLNAFSRMPQMLGAAFRRYTNRLVYALLKNNGNMSDGIALFAVAGGARVNTNLFGSAALASGTLDAGWTAMVNQKGMQTETGENGESSLIGAVPRYLLLPPALRRTARQLLYSSGDITDNKSSAVINPEQGLLEDIVEPELSNGTNGSTSTWFIAADPNSVDTVEVGFLDGMDAPTLEETTDGDILGMGLRAFHDVGAGAIDPRGLQKNQSAAL